MSTGSSVSPSNIPGKTCTNAQYKFSITPDPLFDISFANANGTKVGASYVDGVQVSVHKLSDALRPS